jgi:hypothetical protein
MEAAKRADATRMQRVCTMKNVMLSVFLAPRKRVVYPTISIVVSCQQTAFNAK